MTTALHEQRFDAVRAVLMAAGVQSVVDLGCGDGALVERLAPEPWIERIVAIEPSTARLEALRARLAAMPTDLARKITARQGSALAPDPALAEVDAVLLVEVLEHLEPDRLSLLERAVFAQAGMVVVTTPNADYNPLLGVPPTRLRHPEHRFEWGAQRFCRWAEGVASRSGHGLTVDAVGVAHPDLGAPTQMAVFRRPAAA